MQLAQVVVVENLHDAVGVLVVRTGSEEAVVRAEVHGSPRPASSASSSANSSRSRSTLNSSTRSGTNGLGVEHVRTEPHAVLGANPRRASANRVAERGVQRDAEQHDAGIEAVPVNPLRCCEPVALA